MGARDGFVPAAQGEAQEVQLFLRGGEEEIALVFCHIERAVEFGLARLLVHDALNVMARRHAIGAEIMGDFEQVAEFDGLVAFHARDRRFALKIAFHETVDDGLFEIVFVIEDVMREAFFFCDAAGIVNILPRAARAFFGDGRAVIVKLQRDADDIIPLFMEQRRRDG